MRLDIPTEVKTKDVDLKALVIMQFALSQMGTPRMIEANLSYIADKYGYTITAKKD